MSAEEKNIRIKQRVDTIKEWTDKNPVLLENEIGIEAESGRWKMGDGETAWNDLKLNENSRGYKIKQIKATRTVLADKDAINHIEVGDIVFVKASSKKCGEVTEISSKGGTSLVITGVEQNTMSLEEDGDDLENGVIENVVMVIGKPELGDTYVGYWAEARGQNTIAQGRAAMAEGRATVALGDYSHAEGLRTKASLGGHSEGQDTEALGDQAHAEGFSTKANGSYSHAEGYETEASSYQTHAEGLQSKATASVAHAEGYQTEANGNSAHSEGYKTVSSGVASHSEGYQNSVTADYGHVEGVDSAVEGIAAHAEGDQTKATGRGSHAEGYVAQASGDYSHAEGRDTVASGYASHAEGKYTTAEGDSSHAEGEDTVASGDYSHAEGHHSQSIGNSSHAEGITNIASGAGAHAQGYLCTANGAQSTAGGLNSTASSTCATAFGKDVTACQPASIALGENNATQNSHEVVMGSFAASTLEATGESSLRIGAGSSDSNRITRFDFKKDGNVYINNPGGIRLINSSSTLTADYNKIAIGKSCQGSGDVEIGNYISSGGNAIAIGNNTVSMGVAIGGSAKAHTADNIAIGGGAASGGTNTYSIAIGKSANADAEYALAIGSGTAAKTQSIAIGTNASTLNKDATIGYSASTQAFGEYNGNSVSIGHSAITQGDNSIAIGSGTSTCGRRNIAIGPNSFSGIGISGFDDNVAIGSDSHAMGMGSISIGAGAIASKADETTFYWPSISIGQNATTKEGIAIGANAAATFGVAIGNGAQTATSGSVAVGQYCTAPSQSTNINSGNIVLESPDASRVVAIGAEFSHSYGSNSIQLGNTYYNDTIADTAEDTFQVWHLPLLNRITGKIPEERLPDIDKSIYVSYNTSMVNNLLFDEKILLATLDEETEKILIQDMSDCPVGSGILSAGETRTLNGELDWYDGLTYICKAQFYFDGQSVYVVAGDKDSLAKTRTFKVTPFTADIQEWTAEIPAASTDNAYVLTSTAPDLKDCSKDNCLFYATVDKWNYCYAFFTASTAINYRLVGVDSENKVVYDQTGNGTSIGRTFASTDTSGATMTGLYIFSNITDNPFINGLSPSRLFYVRNQKGTTTYIGSINNIDKRDYDTSSYRIKNDLENYQDFINTVAASEE